MMNLDDAGDAAVYKEMVEFLNQPGHEISWTAAIRLPNGKLVSNHHKNRPCYGEMRNYGSNSTRPHDEQPGDLPRPIRLGLREGVAVYMPTAKTGQQVSSVKRDYFKYLFSKDSPYREGLDPDNLDWIPDPKNEGEYLGFIIRSGNFKPTVLVNCLINSREYFLYLFSNPDRSGIGAAIQRYRDIYPDKPTSFYHWMGIHFTLTAWGAEPFARAAVTTHSSYCNSWNTSPEHFMIGSTFDLDDGKLWCDPCDYNRPFLAEIFNPVVPKTDPDILKGYSVPTAVRAAIKVAGPAVQVVERAKLNLSQNISLGQMKDVCKIADELIQERTENA